MTKNSFDGFTSYSSSSNENWQQEKNSSCSLTRYHDGILHRNKNNCDHKNHFSLKQQRCFPRVLLSAIICIDLFIGDIISFCVHRKRQIKLERKTRNSEL